MQKKPDRFVPMILRPGQWRLSHQLLFLSVMLSLVLMVVAGAWVNHFEVQTHRAMADVILRESLARMTCDTSSLLADIQTHALWALLILALVLLVYAASLILGSLVFPVVTKYNYFNMITSL